MLKKYLLGLVLVGNFFSLLPVFRKQYIVPTFIGSEGERLFGLVLRRVRTNINRGKSRRKRIRKDIWSGVHIKVNNREIIDEKFHYQLEKEVFDNVIFDINLQPRTVEKHFENKIIGASFVEIEKLDEAEISEKLNKISSRLKEFKLFNAWGLLDLFIRGKLDFDFYEQLLVAGVELPGLGLGKLFNKNEGKITSIGIFLTCFKLNKKGQCVLFVKMKNSGDLIGAIKKDYDRDIIPLEMSRYFDKITSSYFSVKARNRTNETLGSIDRFEKILSKSHYTLTPDLKNGGKIVTFFLSIKSMSAQEIFDHLKRKKTDVKNLFWLSTKRIRTEISLGALCAIDETSILALKKACELGIIFSSLHNFDEEKKTGMYSVPHELVLQQPVFQKPILQQQQGYQREVIYPQQHQFNYFDQSYGYYYENVYYSGYYDENGLFIPYN